MERRRPVDSDSLALVLAATLGELNRSILSTRVGVYGYLWADTWNLWSLNRLLPPESVPEALWWYLGPGQ